MPKGLKRYYGNDHLHFLTCSLQLLSPTAVGAASAAQKEEKVRTRRVVATARAARVAAALLRFQCVGRTQADREAAVHASQSGEAGAGTGAGAVEVEQLS